MKPVVIARAAFFAAFAAAQVALIVHAQAMPDRVFGFQMFNASSELKITLFRQIRLYGEPYLLKVQDGSWQAHDKTGKLRTFRWGDRVRDGVLGQLDHFVHASYGLDAQLFRLCYALGDVVRYSADDVDTEALVLSVETVKNGRERAKLRMVGAHGASTPPQGCKP